MVKEKGTRIREVIIRGLLTVSLAAGLSGFGMVSANAAEVTGTFEGHPLFNHEYKTAEITEGADNSLTNRGASYPSIYDPRLNGKVSEVEDQGDTDTCWAFSSIAAVESNLIKKGYANSSINLSENHLAYFFYNRTDDKLGNTEGDQNINATKEWYAQGGLIEGTATHLMTWAGVVKETAAENYGNGEYKPIALSAGDCNKGDYRVTGTYFYNYSVNNVKKAVTDYGAVACGMYIASNYWNASTSAYYCYVEDNNGDGYADGNHAVTIVGWDDTYSRNNFKRNPGSDGAWIVKNSYGSSFGDNGYMYISYADVCLAEIAAYDVVPTTKAYNNNYQYDGSANPSSYFNFASGTTCANVFKTKASSKGYNEILKAVGIETYTTNVKYSLQIYTGLTSGSKPTSGKAMFSSKQTGTLTNAGYNSITLKSPVTLTAGEKYAVVITVSSSNLKEVRVACDTNMSSSWIAFCSSGDAGQSFVYYKNKWYDLYRETTGIVRIKAYTDNTTVKTSYKLSSTSIGLSKGSSTTLKLNIAPSSVKRKITWSTSNKKIATVSSSGKVKAKAYGTVTIKAKFVAGSSTKTLKCKITVGPSKVKNFKATGGNKKITVKWKRNSAASGYVIYYSTAKNSGYKALGTLTSGSKKSYTKKKLSSGTYYVKMRPYLKKGGKKLYGSYTSVKKVTVK